MNLAMAKRIPQAHPMAWRTATVLGTSRLLPPHPHLPVITLITCLGTTQRHLPLPLLVDISSPQTRGLSCDENKEDVKVSEVLAKKQRSSQA